MAFTVGDICKIILAVILPPLGVFAEKERCDKDVLINILLTCLGFIPGKDLQNYMSDPSAVSRAVVRPLSHLLLLHILNFACAGIIHALYIILKY